jgi:hypothetical protein
MRGIRAVLFAVGCPATLRNVLTYCSSDLPDVVTPDMIGSVQQARADRRSKSDYENDIRAEAWSIHLGQKLGVDQAAVEADVQERLRNLPK